MMSWDLNSSLSFFTLEEKKSGDDNELLGLLLSFALVEKNAKNENKLGASLSSSAIEAKQPRTMTS